MSNKANKYLFLTASTLMSLACLTGCGGKPSGPDIDKNKTQLYVKYNNGGFGDVWINKLDAEFTEMYKDHSFEEGKKGIQIIRDDTKRNVGATDVRGNVNMVYIQENNNYSEYLAAGSMLDITDLLNDNAVTGDGTKESGKKIIDKIDQTYKDYLNWGNKYYAVPLFEGNVGLNYNVELFEKMDFFFRKGATADDFTEEDFNDMDKIYDLFVDKDLGILERSTGPDGATGMEGKINHSLDDGLPATYKDFRALLIMMREKTVTPFIWNSTDPNYLTSLCNDVWATNEGKDNFINNFKMQGNATDLVKITNNKVVRDGDGKPVTETLTVTTDNNYEFSRQKGKLEALDFAQYFTEKGNYYADSFSTSYTTALEYFINSAKHSRVGDIGMIVEGSWFLQEAQKAGCFNGSEAAQFAAKFSPMVLPKVDRSHVGETYVRTNDRKSLMFISNFITGVALEVSKLYFSFLQSDHALEAYTFYTHNPRAMLYDISDATYNKMSYFGKCNWDISRNYNSYIVPFLPMSEAAKSRESEINSLTFGFATATTSGNPIKNLIDWKTKSTPKTSDEYFVDIYNYKKA